MYILLNGNNCYIVTLFVCVFYKIMFGDRDEIGLYKVENKCLPICMYLCVIRLGKMISLTRIMSENTM